LIQEIFSLSSVSAETFELL